RGALDRTESRGAHYRSDYPDKVSGWRKNILVRRADDGSMTMGYAEASEPTPSVQQALAEDHELDYHHLE
ncbi:MAG: succinate dehydrogenase, partial [Bacteroidota bacterium]